MVQEWLVGRRRLSWGRGRSFGTDNRVTTTGNVTEVWDVVGTCFNDLVGILTIKAGKRELEGLRGLRNDWVFGEDQGVGRDYVRLNQLMEQENVFYKQWAKQH